ncbi:MAG: hypothetical protein COT74_08145 [Bdellovibrionales bacterium CG10_big_fil_rev_8_21_14_0_10_45_34]|nr:MAG: hypothetical protein COT74_08145 [Bdellovibrionales bacterium CG10_big_fil_rev_8_21_14_0_10_45_34]
MGITCALVVRWHSSKTANKLLIFFGVFVLASCSKPVTFAERPSAFSDDVFYQKNGGNKMDILVINDNSISMVKEQAEMGGKIQNLLDTLTLLDWRIAMTTTDVSNRALGLKGDLLATDSTNLRIIDRQTPRANAQFLELVSRPESIECYFPEYERPPSLCPSDYERPITAVSMAIAKAKSQNSDFFRDDADLALLFLTDEDEDFRESPEVDGKGTTAETLLNEFNQLWGRAKSLYAYGIIVKPEDSDCLESQQSGGFVSSFGSEVNKLIDLTGGLSGSICSEDYGQILSEVGDHMVDRGTSFMLRHRPVEHSFSLTLDPPQDIPWGVSGQVLYFAAPPARGTEIRTNYRYWTE